MSYFLVVHGIGVIYFTFPKAHALYNYYEQQGYSVLKNVNKSPLSGTIGFMGSLKLGGGGQAESSGQMPIPLAHPWCRHCPKDTHPHTKSIYHNSC